MMNLLTRSCVILQHVCEAEPRDYKSRYYSPRAVILLDVSLPHTEREMSLSPVSLTNILRELHIELGNSSHSLGRSQMVFVFRPDQEDIARHSARTIANYFLTHYRRQLEEIGLPLENYICLFHAIFDPTTRTYSDPDPTRLSTIPY